MGVWDFVGILIVVLGAFLVVGGIGLPIILLRERSWWKRLFDGLIAILPELGLGGMADMIQQLIRGLLDRIFLYVRLGALLGGIALGVIGVVLIVFGVLIFTA